MAIQYGILYFETFAKNSDVEKIFIHFVKALRLGHRYHPLEQSLL